MYCAAETKGTILVAQPGRVLIVDDSARARAALRTLLALWPELEVVGEAINGQEAIRLVEERCPTVVLMDLEMPLMDGVEATRLIKARWPGINIVVLSLNASHHAEAIAAGASVFVRKGDAPEQLRIALVSGNVSLQHIQGGKEESHLF